MKKLIIILAVLCHGLSFADSTNTIFYFKLNATIDPVSNRYVQLALNDAEEKKADLVILELNTYGGVVFDADEIVSRIVSLNIPVWVYINKNAGSAGSFISVACDSIFMSKGAFIGASTVVNQEGYVMPEKRQSAMRAEFRATAEATGKNPDLCELFVGKNLGTDSAFVLSLTTKEAIDSNICIASYENITDLLKGQNITNYKILKYKQKSIDKLIAFFIHPAIKSLLVLIIIGGIYFELQTPGVGFPILAAFIGVVFYFLPDYLHGLLDNWELIIFALGFLLLALEIFVIPGFGIAGITGVIFILSSLILSMLKNKGLDFDYVSNDDLVKAFSVLFVSLFGASFLVVFGTRALIKSKTFKNLSVESVIQQKAVNTNEELIGQEGIVFSTLRLIGKIEINGKLYDAQSLYGYIEKGEKVTIFATEGAFLKVKKSV